MRLFKKTLLPVVISILSCHASAATQKLPEEPSAKRDNYDTMVVTASGFEQEIDNASASISIVTQEQLQKQPATNLIDMVKHVEGISVTGSDASYRDISIRGLPAEYTLILVDGKRQNTRESRPNGNGGFESGFIPPVGAIERIEVVRGPMSSLYGSDAMGGVINIITKKSQNIWQGSLGLNGTLQQHSKYGNDIQGDLWLSGPLIDDMLFMQIYGKEQYSAEDKIIDGRFAYRNHDGGVKFTLTPNQMHSIELDVGRTIQEKEYIKDRSKTENGRIYNARNHISISYIGNWDIGSSYLSLYQEETKREVTTKTGIVDSRKPEIMNTVFDAKFVLPLERQTLTFGGQYQYAKLRDDSVNGSAGGIATFARKSVGLSQHAFFLEDELALTDDLSATLGARLDNHEKYGNNWSPRGYLVYHVSDSITLKGGVARAYRAPSIREITPSYLTSTQKNAGVIYGNENLKPETSTTQEISINYHNEAGLRASLTLFNTELKNKLTSWSTRTKDSSTGLWLWEYGNIGRANIKGIETALTLPLNEQLLLSANYSYLLSKRKTDDETYSSSGLSLKGDPLSQTPKHKFNIKLDWQMSELLSSYIDVTYTGKQIWAASRNSYNLGPRYQDAYTTVDIGTSYNFTDKIQFNAAILNLLDYDAEIDSKNGGNWDVIEGRRLWLGLNVGF